MVADSASEQEIVCERHGAAGVIQLNRPHALNALTLGMVRVIDAALDAWEHDPAVRHVVVTAAGGRAFCAGGDLRHLYDLGKAGRTDEALVFWREEYQLNARIKRYPKPYIAMVDGIVMGGGVGVSLHGSHRVAGERYSFAYPEVGIGFFPDVGATYALPRLPGEMGLYLAMTGDRAGQADGVALGLATHAAPSSAFAAIVDALIAGRSVDAVLAAHPHDPGPSPMLTECDPIDACFAADDVAGILTMLDEAAARGSGFAADTAATIRTKSPTSLAIAFAQMRRGGALEFEEAMRLEFRIVSRVVEGHDFYEGVRAVIVDKDQSPRWSPARIEDVTPDLVAAYIAPLGPGELAVPARE